MLAPLPETAPASTGDSSLDALLDALDAPHGDARANAAEAELYEREPSEEILLARLAQVLDPVGRTEVVADMNLTGAEERAADEQARLLVPAAHQLATHVGRLARVIIAGCRSEAADRVLAGKFLSHPSRQVRCAIGDALIGKAGSWKCEPDRWATAPALELITAAIDLPPARHTYDIAQRVVAANAVAMTSKGGGFDRMARYTTLEAAREDEYTAAAILGALLQHVPVDEIDPRWFPHLAPLHHHGHGPGVTVPGFYKQFLDPRAVEPLCTVLDEIIANKSGPVHGILDVLAELGDTRAVPAIVRVLKDCKYGWEPAIDALRKLGDPSIADELDALLAKRKAKPDKAKKPAPLAKLVKELRAKGAPVKAKAPPKPKPKKPAKPPPKGVPKHWTEPPALDAPASGDKQLDKLLVDLESDSDRTIASAVKALAARTDDAATAAIRARLIAAARGVVEFGWHHDKAARLVGPAKAAHNKAYTKLLPAFMARSWLVHRLGSLLVARQDREGERALLELHQTHANATIRDNAALALLGRAAKEDIRAPAGPVASTETLAKLADTLTETRSPFAAEAAFLVEKAPIARFAKVLVGDDLDSLLHVVNAHVDAKADKGWLDVIIPLLEGEHALLAVWILGKLADKRAVEPLVRYIERQAKGTYMDEHAALALGAIGDPRGVGGMLTTLEHPNLTTRFSAVAEAVRRLGDATHIPRLEALATKLKKEKVPWREPKIVDELIEALAKKRARAQA